MKFFLFLAPAIPTGQQEFFFHRNQVHVTKQYCTQHLVQIGHAVVKLRNWGGATKYCPSLGGPQILTEQLRLNKSESTPIEEAAYLMSSHTINRSDHSFPNNIFAAFQLHFLYPIHIYMHELKMLTFKIT